VPLTATVLRWNENLPKGIDPDFGRADTIAAVGYNPPEPMTTAPYYAVRFLPAQLIQSHVGIEIDASARALGAGGAPIPGLFAAGEAGGGVLGPYYVGACALANALTMGRIAGRRAAGG
jgi:predicted oxidoreductase